MTAYTWHLEAGTRGRTFTDDGREITARIAPMDGVYFWTVSQWGRVLAANTAPRLADARTAAETWIATLTEVTPA
jgi:uncharacterized protein YfaP (DUF2135 family)